MKNTPEAIVRVRQVIPRKGGWGGIKREGHSGYHPNDDYALDTEREF